jgi:hypothetical protein
VSVKYKLWADNKSALILAYERFGWYLELGKLGQAKECVKTGWQFNEKPEEVFIAPSTLLVWEKVE